MFGDLFATRWRVIRIGRRIATVNGVGFRLTAGLGLMTSRGVGQRIITDAGFTMMAGIGHRIHAIAGNAVGGDRR